MEEVIQGGEVLLIFGFVLGAEFEDDFESLFLEEAFAEVVDDVLFLFDQVVEDLALFVLFLVFVLVQEVLFLVYFLDLEFLIVFREFLVFINEFIELFLLLLNMGLDIGQLIIGMFLNDPLEFGQYLIGLHALHGWGLELFPQGDKLHVLLAVLVDL